MTKVFHGEAIPTKLPRKYNAQLVNLGNKSLVPKETLFEIYNSWYGIIFLSRQEIDSETAKYEVRSDDTLKRVAKHKAITMYKTINANVPSYPSDQMSFAFKQNPYILKKRSA